MRQLFYRTAMLLVFLAFLMPSVLVFAEEEAPLYEKYGYRSSYIYNDEMIANALKVTVPQIRMVYSATIIYEPVTFDKAYAVGMFHTIREEAGEASTAGDIAAAVLDDMRRNTEKYLTLGYQTEKKTEGVFIGGGVVIGENGYIATNSRVAGLDENSKKEMYYYGLREEVDRNISRLTEGFEKYGVSFSDKEIDSFCNLILEFAVKNLQIVEDEVKIEVYLPAGYVATDADTAWVYEAEVVAGDGHKGKELPYQDAAILKIDAENLVALNLSETYPELNSKVASAGFQGSENGSFYGLDNEPALLNITVENGSVSRLIPIEGTGYQTIGITSALSGGSSGGPSVDANLDIEGLNTYINAQDNRFGYMVPAEIVKNLSSGLDIGQGEVSKIFMTGLQLLQDGYGPAAVECFRRVAEYQSETPYINNIIELAEAAPDNQYVAKKDTMDILMIVAAGLAVVLVVAFLVVLVIAGKRKKKPAVASVGGAVPLYSDDNGVEDEAVSVMATVSEDTVPIVSYKPPVPEDAPRPVISKNVE